MINDLTVLGLNTSENEVFQILLEHDTLSASQIANLLGFKRPTVYIYLEKLRKEGLITESILSNKKFFKVISTTAFEEKVRKQIDALRKLKEEIPKKIKVNKSLPKTSLKIFNDTKSLLNLADEALTYEGDMYFLGSFDGIEHILDDKFYDKYYKKRHQKSYNDYIISAWFKRTVEAYYKESTIFNKRRFLPKEIYPKGGFAIFDDKIAIIQNGVKPTGVIIQDRMLAETLKLAYIALWKDLEGKNIPPKP